MTRPPNRIPCNVPPRRSAVAALGLLAALLVGMPACGDATSEAVCAAQTEGCACSLS